MEKLIVSNDTFFEEVIVLLREGKKVTVPAKGESMLPFIVGGVDSVVLEGGRWRIAGGNRPEDSQCRRSFPRQWPLDSPSSDSRVPYR